MITKFAESTSRGLARAPAPARLELQTPQTRLPLEGARAARGTASLPTGTRPGAQRPQLHVRVFTFPSMCDTSLRCCLDTSSTGTPSTPTLSPNKIKTPGCCGQPEGNGPPRATQHRPQGEPAPDLGSSAFSVGLSVLPGRAWHGPGARLGHCLLPSDATATISANILKVRSPAARQARTAN